MLPGRKERSDISTARSAWRRPFRGSSICVATAHGPNVALLECQTAHEPRLRASATRLDRASASGADPAKSEIPENPVFVEIIKVRRGPKRSENGWQNPKRLAVRLAEIGSLGVTQPESVLFDRIEPIEPLREFPAAGTAPSTDRLTPCPDACRTCGGKHSNWQLLASCGPSPGWVRAVHPRTRGENCRPILLAGQGTAAAEFADPCPSRVGRLSRDLPEPGRPSRRLEPGDPVSLGLGSCL